MSDHRFNRDAALRQAALQLEAEAIAAEPWHAEPITTQLADAADALLTGAGIRTISDPLVELNNVVAAHQRAYNDPTQKARRDVDATKAKAVADAAVLAKPEADARPRPIVPHCHPSCRR